ncbi:hypothetical protein AB6817_01490 [Carnobacterium maltaromaticum]
MENQQVEKKKGLEYWQFNYPMLCLGWHFIIISTFYGQFFQS